MMVSSVNSLGQAIRDLMARVERNRPRESSIAKLHEVVQQREKAKEATGQARDLRRIDVTV